MYAQYADGLRISQPDKPNPFMLLVVIKFFTLIYLIPIGEKPLGGRSLVFENNHWNFQIIIWPIPLNYFRQSLFVYSLNFCVQHACFVEEWRQKWQPPRNKRFPRMSHPHRVSYGEDIDQQGFFSVPSFPTIALCQPSYLINYQLNIT